MAKNVLIFDSGVGGLSVYQEIQSLLPNMQYTYVFDNAAFPYGELDSDVLIKRTSSIVEQFTLDAQIDLVVIACNTASTIVLPTLREKLSIPVVGVVPAIKPAALLSSKKCIGLLATPATVERDYTYDLINQFASGVEVVMMGSTRLVEIAEEKLRGETPDLQELECILQEWIGLVDSIVLGCTHFPLLRQEIQAVMGEDVKMVDSGLAIAKRVQSLLGNKVGYGEVKLNRVYCSAAPKNEAALNRSLHAMNLSQVTRLHLPDL